MKDEAPFAFAGIWDQAKGWHLDNLLLDHHYHTE